MMTTPSQRQIVAVLLERHGRTFSDELGIDLEKGTPSPLFRWLCASLLFSARISTNLAMRAAKALADEGWTTAEKMAHSTWEQRTKALNRSGYARYDERTSTMLGDTSAMLLDRYQGDLRNLREEAQRDPGQERKLLKQFKGLGDVGVNIFFREVQSAWDELVPFADARALETAQNLELGNDARALARLVDQQDFPRFVAALVRVGLSGDQNAVLEEAASGA